MKKGKLSFAQKMLIVWGIAAVPIILTALDIYADAFYLLAPYLGFATIITAILKKNYNKNRVQLPPEAKKLERAYKNNELKEYLLGEKGYMYYDEFGREPEVGTGNLYAHAIEGAIIPLNDYVGENKVIDSLLSTVREMILSGDAIQINAGARFLRMLIGMHAAEKLVTSNAQISELLSLANQKSNA